MHQKADVHAAEVDFTFMTPSGLLLADSKSSLSIQKADLGRLSFGQNVCRKERPAKWRAFGEVTSFSMTTGLLSVDAEPIARNVSRQIHSYKLEAVITKCWPKK